MISPLVFTALILSAPTSFTQEPGAFGFSSFQDLAKWARSGSFGGGQVDLVSDHGHEIAIVNHRYTSGVDSSGITIFVKRGARWQEALRLGPYWLRSVEFKQSGDRVMLKLSDSHREILRFSIAELHEQADRQAPNP